MEVKIEKPNILQILVRPDKTEELYSKCMWLRITFDLDNWSMNCQSDCGNYSYGWAVEKERTFLKLMTQIDKQYLLGKVSNRTQFDVKASKENIVNWVYMDEDLTPEERDAKIEAINDIENYSDEQEFFRELEEIDGISEYADLWEVLESDYPTSAKTFVEIFETIIQPKIKEYLAD